jgi:hypothetical protein
MMNQLQSEQLPKAILKHQPLVPSNENGDDDDDDIFTANDDDQANMRRRAPTRHSIKSLSGRKTLSKQAVTTEVK